MGISLRRLGKSLRDGTAVRRFWAALTVENSFPAVAFNGQQYALPAYGPELVSNGTFDSVTTGWSGISATLSVVGNALRVTGTVTGAGSFIAQATATVTPGKLYECSFDQVALTGTNLTGTFIVIRCNGTSVGQSTLSSGNGRRTIYFTPTASTITIQPRVEQGGSGVPGNYADFDNISVREVMLGELGSNLGASGYTMSVNGGTGTATESPTGQLNLTGDGTNAATADKQLTGLTVGAHYRIVCLAATSNPSILVGTTQGGAQVFGGAYTAGVIVLEFTATATTHWVRFSRQPATLSTISSITIAQWTPRPTLRTAAFNEVFAFTGSSTTAKTYVGADGLIKNDLAADTPRWDFSNGKARLLLENASTNLLLRSEEFDNASWNSDSGIPVITSGQTSPTGATTAQLFTMTGSGLQFRYQTVGTSLTSGQLYTFTVYAKTLSGSYAFAVRIRNAGSTNIYTSSVLTANTSWQRFTFTFTPVATETVVLGLEFRAGVVPGVTGAGSCVFWGAQLEAASFASSYIPTTSATVTRTIETARFSPLVEAIAFLPAGTIRVQAAGINPVNGRIIGNRATNDGLIISGGSSGTNRAHIVGLNNASLTPNAVAGSGGTDGSFGAVGSYSSSGRALALNGGSAVSDTNSAGVNTVLYLGRDPAGSSVYGNGYYSSFALWPFRVSNANLPAIAVAPT